MPPPPADPSYETRLEAASAWPEHVFTSAAATHAAAFAGRGRGWRAEELRALARDQGARWSVARGRAASASDDFSAPLLGFALFRGCGDEAELLTICRAPSAARRGVGRALMRVGLAALAAEGATRCVLEVGEGNAAARRLYDEIGFIQIARRRGYYLQGGAGPEDALVLEKSRIAAQ